MVNYLVIPNYVMYGCESWTVKKAEHRRIDAFELWCWRRLLRVPWTTRRSNQSILKEINPEISLEDAEKVMQLVITDQKIMNSQFSSVQSLSHVRLFVTP